MKTPDIQIRRRFQTDWQFWLALSVAPVCWWLMLTLGVSLRKEPLAVNTVILAVLVSPILEEMVFRAGLQGWLLRKSVLQHRLSGAISLANLVTSLLFACLHLFRQPPIWAALVFFPSLVFGWAKERHETLLSPILLHMAYNAGFIWLFA